MTGVHYLIIGGSGFIGQSLTRSLIDRGNWVTIKTRNKQKTRQLFENLGCAPNIIESYNEIDLNKLPANVICLAGAGIVDKRWTKQRKQELVNSRVKPLQDLAEWLNHNNLQLDKLLIGSAIGYYGYGNNPEHELNESSSPHNDFVHQLCQETESQSAHFLQTFKKTICLRTGVTLGKSGGALAKMTLPAKFCLNGAIGNGQQWVSWIHIDDWIAATMHIMSLSNPAKSYNLCATKPVRNAELSHAIGSALNRKFQLPIPSFTLNFLLGEAAVLLTGSQNVYPQQLVNEGFQFRYPEIDKAIKSLL